MTDNPMVNRHKKFLDLDLGQIETVTQPRKLFDENITLFINIKNPPNIIKKKHQLVSVL
jgi:hypothetical protein